MFNTALNSTSNKDTITDFASAQDTIQLENAIFTKLLAPGALSDNNFITVTGTGGAMDKNDYIIYNSDTGILSYDADGSGAGHAIQFATLIGQPAITVADFLVS